MRSTIRSRSLLIATLLLPLLGLAGCGGGDGTLTKAELVSKGDAICKSAHDQFAQLQKSPPSTAAEAAALTGKLISISENELNQLRDLNVSADVKPALDRYLAAREQGIAVLKKGLAAAQNGNARAYAAAQATIAKSQVKRLRLAQAVGFRECSRPIGSGAAAGS
jgi:hypothetical protein